MTSERNDLKHQLGEVQRRLERVSGSLAVKEAQAKQLSDEKESLVKQIAELSSQNSVLEHKLEQKN